MFDHDPTPLDLVPRKPATFEALNLLLGLSSRFGIKLNDPSLKDLILEHAVRDAEAILVEPHRQEGLHAQRKFESLIRELGRYRRLKHDDAGEVWTADGKKIRPPDYRVDLRDGTSFLVEVKSTDAHGFGDVFSLPKQVYRQHLAYLLPGDPPLKFAIYWKQWRLWTLVDPSAFTKKKATFYIGVGEAMVANEMARFGDAYIAVGVPLTIRIEFEPIPIVEDEEGYYQVTIRRVVVLCQGQHIKEDVAKNLAIFAMFYGPGLEGGDGWRPQVRDGKLWATDLEVTSDEAAGGKAHLGPLSTLHAGLFDRATRNDHGLIDQFDGPCVPNRLARLLPGPKFDYKRSGLRLMVMHQATPEQVAVAKRGEPIDGWQTRRAEAEE